MSTADGFGRLAFIFTWKIENFSHCVQKRDECLISPVFVAETLANTKWCMELYPRGDEEEKTITLWLCREESDCGPKELTIDFEFSLLLTTGHSNLARNYKEKNRSFACGDIGLGESINLKIGEPMFINKSYDTLTICCRMWSMRKTQKIGNCLVQTRVTTEKTSFIWHVKDFRNQHHNESQEACSNLVSNPRITPTLKLITTDGTDFARDLQVEVSQVSNKANLTVCRIEVLDTSKTVVAYVQNKYWYKHPAKKVVWKLPKLFNVPSNLLCLQCKLAVSDGEISYIESTSNAFKTMDDIGTDMMFSDAFHGLKDALFYVGEQSQTASVPNTLKDDLQTLYESKKLSDFTLQTGSTQFLVHKNILSVRSPIFGAMFDSNMKEGQTGSVDIPDLDTDALNRLLVFVYTDKVEDLKWESASKLFFAADKYAILPLREKCSDFLKANLNEVNACKILALADLHQEERLKLAAQKFIASHDSVIICSNEWKTLEKVNLQLAVDTLKQIYVKKIHHTADLISSTGHTYPSAFRTLKDDLHNLYNSKQFSDFILQTGCDKFHVHRNILSVRSPVFSAMFDSNMKEAQTGSVDVPDLDADTLNRLLMFVYTDTIEELDWKHAAKLFCAADKYAIQPLKEYCLAFLKTNLDKVNACEILAIADLHQEKSLLLAAQKFISVQYSVILCSNEWKAFEKDNLQLAVDTIKQILLKE